MTLIGPMQYRVRGTRTAAVASVYLLLAGPSKAADGGTVDALADAISWIALILGPIVLIGLNYYVNIHPERIARKRRHPQLPAIKALIVMSSLFGGLFWPIAWVWASSKPVLHKLAYGTDVDEEIPIEADRKDKELDELRATVADLRAQLRNSGEQPKTT
jgi:hypothetical protein